MNGPALVLIGADGDGIPLPAGTWRDPPLEKTARWASTLCVVTSIEAHWIPSTGLPLAPGAGEASCGGVGVGIGGGDADVEPGCAPLPRVTRIVTSTATVTAAAADAM